MVHGLTLVPDSKPPVRLKVAYRTPQSLISEFTRSVGTGSVTLETRKALALGTRFVFELHAAGLASPIEVEGEVLQVNPGTGGRFLIHVRYEAPADQPGLGALIQRIFENHDAERGRKHARIPIHLRATEDAPYSPSYVVSDLSSGGLGIQVEAPALPPQVQMGAPFLLELSLSFGALALHGEVAWTFHPPRGGTQWINPSFGIGFGKLRADSQERLGQILTLRGLPPPPWKARISFGESAVARMP